MCGDIKMDSNKIGKLIYELRIKNNLTQKQLADKLLITSQAISKWENGRGIPDVEMLQKLSEIFNVNINELLSGKITETKKRKIKKIYLLIPISLIILIALLILLIIKNNNDDFKITKLASNNDSFSIKGIIAYSENKKSIYISKVDYDNEHDEEEYSELECILYEVNENVEKKISQCGTIQSNNKNENVQTSTLSELLKNVEFNVDDYSCSCDTIVCNKLYLKINALNKNNQTITYNIPIELESSCTK